MIVFFLLKVKQLIIIFKAKRIFIMDKSKGSCRPSNDPDLVKVDLKLLNHMIHDKNDMYNLLASKCGYILPSLTSKAITSEYLQGILTGKFWVMQYKEFNPYRWVALNTVKTKSSLIDTLAELIPKGKELGFDKVNTPDKKWLIDAIHSLKPDHHLFDGATHAAVNKSIKKAIRKGNNELMALKVTLFRI